MKRIDLGKTIAIVANLGVIGGLLLLAFELSQNNELLRAQADYNYFQHRRANRQDIVTDPAYADLWVKFRNREPLTEAEQLRLDFHIEQTILAWQWEFGQLADGNLRDDRESVATRYQSGLSKADAFSARFPTVWAYFQSEVRPDFVDFMNSEVIE